MTLPVRIEGLIERFGRVVALDGLDAGDDDLRCFRAQHGADVERRSLDLELRYPLLAAEARR